MAAPGRQSLAAKLSTTHRSDDNPVGGGNSLQDEQFTANQLFITDMSCVPLFQFSGD
jgi:hypothetical protein